MKARLFYAGLVVALALIGYAWVIQGLPSPLPLKDSAWVQKRFGLQAWTPLDQAAPLAVRAILLSEDDTFFEHHGVRFDELGSAAWEDLLALRYQRGASSVTQQVVKNALLSNEKTLRRKLREIVLARRADAVVGKRRLLEDYLNLAEWGPHRERGIAWAAGYYFSKTPAQLTAREGALLAWLLPDPHRRARELKRNGLSPKARRHVDRLLDRLVDEGGLTQADADAQRDQPTPFERLTAPAVKEALPPSQGAP